MLTFEIPADLPRLPTRKSESHKGTFGTALLIGGSRGMAGAIALSGMACLRSGAGKVRLAVPDACLETVAQFDPSYMTVPLDCNGEGCLEISAVHKIEELRGSATCIAIGPGLTCSEQIGRLVSWLFRTLPQPLIVDADGLNALAYQPEALSQAGGPRVLTPHPGEFARLAKSVGIAYDASIDAQQRAGFEMAKRFGLVVVLKGHHTLVTDGQVEYRNTTGNPGMATGGSGDVLTGIITALVCQGLSPLDAARLGVFAHGVAGDIAAESMGMVGMTARDILNALPHAWQRLAR